VLSITKDKFLSKIDNNRKAEIMPFTIEFDDKKLTEKIKDPYKKIDATFPMGATLSEFISLGDDLSKKHHIYQALDEEGGRIHKDSLLYIRMLEYVKLCAKLPELYCLEDFMFFLHLEGLSVPSNHVEFSFDENQELKYSLKNHLKMNPFEEEMRGFHGSDKSLVSMTTVYTCETVEDVCMASFYHLITHGKMIKPCQNCGNYFVPLQRSDSIYCTRTSPYNKTRTCREDGAQRAYEEKASKDELTKEYRKVYQALQMRAKRNPEDVPGFEQWKEDATKWKRRLKRGKVTEEQFLDWLSECLYNY